MINISFDCKLVHCLCKQLVACENIKRNEISELDFNV